jgi:hypothetical protein
MGHAFGKYIPFRHMVLIKCHLVMALDRFLPDRNHTHRAILEFSF